MAQFASDTFTNTDETELTSHSATWVEHANSTGELRISGNRCYCVTSAQAIYYNTGTPAGANYEVSADLYVKSINNLPGVLARVDTTATTFYMARYSYLAGGWQLFKAVGGTFTQLGSTVTQSLSLNTSYAIKLKVDGTTIELYKEGSGTASISVTDSAISAAGKSGLRDGIAGSSLTGIHFDNFSADDIGAVATGSPWYYYAMQG